MTLQEAIGVLSETSAIVTMNSTELLMLSFVAPDQQHDIEMMRVDLASAAVKEAFAFPAYAENLDATLAEIAAYALAHGFATATWERMAF